MTACRLIRYLLLDQIPHHQIQRRQRISYGVIGGLGILYGVAGMGYFLIGGLGFVILGIHLTGAAFNGSCPIRKFTSLTGN